MVVRMRANRSKSGRRRSQHALMAKNASPCECGAFRLTHRACQMCGKYRGRVVIDVVANAVREARRAKRKQKELQASGQATSTTKEKEPAETS